MSKIAKSPAAAPYVVASIPAIFVLLWSTGFVGAKFGLPYAEPATFLAYRFTIAGGILILLALVCRAPWPGSPAAFGHIMVSGLMVQGIYLGGVFYSLHLGVEAWVSALISGIQPVLVAVIAGPILKERISRRQWLGFCLGLIGVALVVWRKLDLGLGTPLGMAFSVAALIGISVGTIYQKRFCAHMDLRTGSALQLITVAAVMWGVALLFESREVNWTLEFIGAMIWLCLVLSLGAFLLLFLMIRQGQASRVASLFFLVPPCTAVVSYFLFDETFGAIAILGMAITVAGVALVNSEKSG